MLLTLELGYVGRMLELLPAFPAARRQPRIEFEFEINGRLVVLPVCAATWMEIFDRLILLLLRLLLLSAA